MTMFSVATFLHERFLRDHGHLISPWNFGPAAAKACSESLLRRNWLYWEKKRAQRQGEVRAIAENGLLDYYNRANREVAEPVDKPPA